MSDLLEKVATIKKSLPGRIINEELINDWCYQIILEIHGFVSIMAITQNLCTNVTELTTRAILTQEKVFLIAEKLTQTQLHQELLQKLSDLAQLTDLEALQFELQKIVDDYAVKLGKEVA
jgi:hypothetical protein